MQTIIKALETKSPPPPKKNVLGSYQDYYKLTAMFFLGIFFRNLITPNRIGTLKKKILTVHPTDGDAFEDGDEQNTPSSRVGIHDW